MNWSSSRFLRHWMLGWSLHERNTHSNSSQPQFPLAGRQLGYTRLGIDLFLLHILDWLNILGIEEHRWRQREFQSFFLDRLRVLDFEVGNSWFCSIDFSWLFMVVVGCKNPHHKTRKFGLLLHPMIFDVWLLLWMVEMAEMGEFGASGAFWFWWMNYHSLMVFSMSEMVSSISSSVSLLSSILVNVRLKIVMMSSSLVIHEVNVFLTVRILVSYLDRRLLIWFNIHFLMMYLIMVGFLKVWVMNEQLDAPFLTYNIIENGGNMTYKIL